MTTMVVMGGDWSYTLNEYGVPAGQRYLLFTEGYRKKALRKRWLGWVLSIEFLLFATSHPAWMPNLVVCFIYAAVPLLLVSLIIDIRFWRKARFCPACEAVTHWPGWKTKTDYCHNCGRLLDPAHFLIDPPSILVLSDERYRHEGKPTVKFIAMVILLAIKDRLTEVRFEPGRDECRLYYRCDGEFYDMVPPPRFMYKQISATLKAMAGLASESKPQSGDLQIKLDGQTILARVECQPTELGENVTLWFPESDVSPNIAESLLQRYCRKMDATAAHCQKS